MGLQHCTKVCIFVTHTHRHTKFVHFAFVKIKNRFNGKVGYMSDEFDIQRTVHRDIFL